MLPEEAGRGLGRFLMELGLQLARDGHTGPVVIEATLNAVVFYERFGFKTVKFHNFEGRKGDWPAIQTAIMTDEL